MDSYSDKQHKCIEITQNIHKIANPQYLMDLLEYHLWADNRLLDRISTIEPAKFDNQLDAFGTSIRSKAIHLVAALQIWLDRLDGRSQPIESVQKPLFAKPAREILAIWKVLSNRLQNRYISKNDYSSVRYTNSQGMKYENAEKEIFTHLFLHANAHRSQINMALRQNELEPVNIDYIVFLRSKSP